MHRAYLAAYAVGIRLLAIEFEGNGIIFLLAILGHTSCLCELTLDPDFEIRQTFTLWMFRKKDSAVIFCERQRSGFYFTLADPCALDIQFVCPSMKWKAKNKKRKQKKNPIEYIHFEVSVFAVRKIWVSFLA